MLDFSSFVISIIVLIFALAEMTNGSSASFKFQNTNIPEGGDDPPCYIAKDTILNSSKISGMDASYSCSNKSEFGELSVFT